MTPLVFVVVLISATLHATWNFAAKRVSGDLCAMWLGICLASVLSWPFAAWVYHPGTVSLHTLSYMVATGLLHVWYFVFLSRSYAMGDISMVYPVARGTGVAGTACVAALVLQEELSVYGILGILTICIGTAVIGWSHRTHAEAWRAYRRALLVGAGIVGYSIVDKLGVARVHPVFYISAMFTLSALLMAPYVLYGRAFSGVRSYWRVRGDIGLIGIGSISTYLLILFTFRIGPVSYIVALREFAVVIGAMLGVVLLKERMTLRKSLGIVAILLGLVLVKIA